MTYSSTTTYIDIDTGEILRTKYAKKYYLTIKTKKDAKIDRQNGKCYVTYTKLCRRNPQGRIFSD